MGNLKRHKTFISFRNPEAVEMKNIIVSLNNKYNIFEDYSIGKGDINRSEFKNDEEIRKEIVSEWVAGASVTILLVTPNMSESKFIDWEMQATMSDNLNNSKMGILCIFSNKCKSINNLNCPTNNEYSDLVKKIVDSSSSSSWTTVNRERIDFNFMDLPSRVRKNLKREGVKIDVISWDALFKQGDYFAAENIKKLIHKAFLQRINNDYDISDKLQRSHK